MDSEQKSIITAANKLRQKKQFAECLALLDDAGLKPLDPEFLTALFLRGDVYCDQNNFAAALECYHKLLSIQETDIAFNNCAFCLREMGRLEEALSKYESALSLNPLNLVSRLAAGEICIKLGLSKRAEEHFLLGVSANPKDARFFSGLGLACFQLEKWTEAYENFLMARNLDSENEIARKGIAHLEAWFELDK